MVGDHTHSLWLASNKFISSFYDAYHTQGSLEHNQPVAGDVNQLRTLRLERNPGGQWHRPGLAGAGSLAYGQAIVDLILAGPSMLYLYMTHPYSPVAFAEQIGQSFIDSCVGLANTLVALVTGKDPETGETLSGREYAELVGGLLGMVVGLISMDFAAGHRR